MAQHGGISTGRFNVTMASRSVLVVFFLALIIQVSHAAVLRVRATNPPQALPQRATKEDLKWQPSLDYDTDGCYNVPAIDSSGHVSEGLDHDNTSGSEDCRDESDLNNSNAYSRQRCNNGICVYLYDYYFEKDVAVEHVLDAGGHRHDWEHIAVWVRDGKAEYVAVSAHGGYEVRSADEVRWDGTHPKVVYHKDGGMTHAFRFANSGDDNVENHKGVWIRSPLVSYNGYPSGIRDILFEHDFGKATIGIKDSQFASNLRKASPKKSQGLCESLEDCDVYIYNFDFGVDDGSPGDPKPTGPSLRVMPLGDSLTAGVLSTDGNGYRRRLHELLEADYDVDFVGSQAIGFMADNDHEGYPGATIDLIRNYGSQAFYKRPNVVLLHAGTNDLHRDVDVSNAPTRLGYLIDAIVSNCPDAVVIVSKIIMAVSQTVEPERSAFNRGVEDIVAKYRSQGKNVALADMSSILQRSDFVDGLHPNNGGYDKMANVWYDAILDALERGVIGNPVTPENPPPTLDEATCPNGFGWKGGLVGDGTGFGVWITWENQGLIAPGVRNANGDNVLLADMDGDGIDDYVLINSKGALDVWLRGIGETSVPWRHVGVLAVGVTGANQGNVKLADVDGDGRADYLLIAEDGSVQAWINTCKTPVEGKRDTSDSSSSLRSRALCPINNPDHIEWRRAGQIIPASSNASRLAIQFADITGDGRADYLVVSSSGAVRAISLQGDINNPTRVDLGTIISGISGATRENVRFADVNGDGRADYLVVWQNGAIAAWKTTGPATKPTWQKLGQIAVGVSGGKRENVRLAYLNYDRRFDYVIINPDNGALNAWYNNLDTEVIGPNIRLADIDGDGRDDYLFLDSKGGVQAWLNHGDYDHPSWQSLGTIAPGVPGGSRERIRFADIDGDGRSDYLLVSDVGAVTVWLNKGDVTHPAWTSIGQVAPGVGGATLQKVRFADIDGDGRDDYCVLWNDGSVDAWLNKGNPTAPTWEKQGKIAVGVDGANGDNVFLVDINGDGKADYLKVTDKGGVYAWLNTGRDPKNILWKNQGLIAPGVGGATRDNIRFGEMDPDGKADYWLIGNAMGSVSVWRSVCA